MQEAKIADVDDNWLTLECSVFEMLIALSRRVATEVQEQPGDWFWKLVQNLELLWYTDDVYEISKDPAMDEEVDFILDRLVARTYSRSGDGGLFPLRESLMDQRKIEIWAQMSAYLLEQHYFSDVDL